MKIFNFKKHKAQQLHAAGEKCSDDGDDDAAIEKYRQAIALDPEKSESHYNIGLIHKYRGAWEMSLKHNQMANALRPDDQAARWNLAIAATALRRWDIARAAWIQNGYTLAGADGPIEMNLGLTPVRLNADDAGEVVWATRMDPVRARIDNIPSIESGFCYADIVLHDGAPEGMRHREGRDYYVFNVLERFEASAYATCSATVELNKDSDLRVLEEILARGSHTLEDWTTNVRMLCKACSEGVPHDEHDDLLPAPWQAKRQLGLALLGQSDVRAIFNEWQGRTGARLVSITPDV